MAKRNKPRPKPSSRNPIGPGRRVVTGVNTEGESTILLDGPVPEHARTQFLGGTSHYLWRIPPGSPDLKDETDTLESISLEKEWYPPPGGVAAAIITYEPGFEGSIHQSDTLDHVFIISGKLELVLEDVTTVVSPGECVIQRGTAHSFRVVGDEPCTFCGVVVGTIHNLRTKQG